MDAVEDVTSTKIRDIPELGSWSFFHLTIRNHFQDVLLLAPNISLLYPSY